MATLRDIRKRIRSVILTRQITNTMMMVAAAKLRRAQVAMSQTGHLAGQLREMFAALQTDAVDETFEGDLLRAVLGPGRVPEGSLELAGRKASRRTVVVFTSDRGLCGSFNANAIAEAERKLIALSRPQPGGGEVKADLVCVGRRGARHFMGSPWKIIRTFDSLEAGFEPSLYWQGYKRWRDAGLPLPTPEEFPSRWPGASDPRLVQGYVRMQRLFELKEFLLDRFAAGLADETSAEGTDEIYLSYTHYYSPARSTAMTVPFLSLKPFEARESADRVDHLFEPDRRTLLSAFMPMYADLMIWASAAHAQTSEQAMRVVAMTTATDLADQLVRSLTLSYNKARQAAITTEILEVNTGAEAARA